MKILFLDIDGVLNSVYYSKKMEYNEFFEKKKIELIKQIVEKTNCKIVLTSLRLNFQLYDNEIKDTLENEGLKIYDTLNLSFISKAESIQRYIKNKDSIENYVVVDDSDYKNDFQYHFVKTSTYYGLTKSKAKKIVELFNIQ